MGVSLRYDTTDRLTEALTHGFIPGHWLDDDGVVRPEYRERAAQMRRPERADPAELLRHAEARK